MILLNYFNSKPKEHVSLILTCRYKFCRIWWVQKLWIVSMIVTLKIYINLYSIFLQRHHHNFITTTSLYMYMDNIWFCSQGNLFWIWFFLIGALHKLNWNLYNLINLDLFSWYAYLMNKFHRFFTNRNCLLIIFLILCFAI